MEETQSALPPAATPPARLTGTLLAINERGFTFVSTGRGKAQFFVHCSDVPTEAWVQGAVIEFTPAAPRAGSKAGRIADAKVLFVPTPNRNRTSNQESPEATS